MNVAAVLRSGRVQPLLGTIGAMRGLALLLMLPALGLVPGCGSTRSSNVTAKAGGSPSTTTSTVSSTSPGAPALQGEATSAGAGDIPDNQVFLTFRGPRYSLRYPEGWAQRASGGTVTFRDKNNIVRILLRGGALPSLQRVSREVGSLRGVSVQRAPAAITLAGAPAVKIVYSSESAPNSVTGKRVKLVVDRYYLARSGKEAIVDLGTPEGVDNVDAYRLMIESFRWR